MPQQQPSDIPSLILNLRSDDHQTRKRAATRLGELHDRRAIAPITEALKREKGEGARIAYFEALVEIGGDESIEPLLFLLQGNGGCYLSNKAAHVLKKLPSSRIVDSVSLFIANGEGWAAGRSNAVYLLSELKDPRCLDALLITALADDALYVREEALGAIDKFPHSCVVSAVNNFLSAKGADLPETVVEALRESKDLPTANAIMNRLWEVKRVIEDANTREGRIEAERLKQIVPKEVLRKMAFELPIETGSDFSKFQDVGSFEEMYGKLVSDTKYTVHGKSFESNFSEHSLEWRRTADNKMTLRYLIDLDESGKNQDETYFMAAFNELWIIRLDRDLFGCSMAQRHVQLPT